MSKVSLHVADVTKFSYHTLRTISSPDDTKKWSHHLLWPCTSALVLDVT